jgi:hypothetical protein
VSIVQPDTLVRIVLFGWWLDEVILIGFTSDGNLQQVRLYKKSLYNAFYRKLHKFFDQNSTGRFHHSDREASSRRVRILFQFFILTEIIKMGISFWRRAQNIQSMHATKTARDQQWRADRNAVYLGLE